MHTIKLPAQPYQLKNGSYVSNPLNGADADINSLLSFLKRTNILKVPTNFTSNGRPMGVSTELNLQDLSPTVVVTSPTERPIVTTPTSVTSTKRSSLRVTSETSREVTPMTTVTTPPKPTTIFCLSVYLFSSSIHQ